MNPHTNNRWEYRIIRNINNNIDIQSNRALDEKVN